MATITSLLLVIGLLAGIAIWFGICAAKLACANRLLLNGTAEHEKIIQELRKNEKESFNIISNLAEGIHVLDKDGKVLFMNAEAERLLGWSSWELKGRNLHSLIHSRKPDDSPLSFEECSMCNVINTGMPYASMDECYTRKDGMLFPISVISSPVMEDGEITSVVTAFRDITVRKQIEREREALIVELQEALSTIKQLHGLLPICASCKKIRDDAGYWNQIESYISEHLEVRFSHGICPECAKKIYPEFYDQIYENKDDKQ